MMMWALMESIRIGNQACIRFSKTFYNFVYTNEPLTYFTDFFEYYRSKEEFFVGVVALSLSSSWALGVVVNWQIAAIGLLGLIVLSDLTTPLFKPSPTFCHWRRWLSFMSLLLLQIRNEWL